MNRNSWSLHVSEVRLSCWRRYSPFRCLASALVGFRLLGLFTQSRGAVGVLFAHCALVGQIPRAVHDDNQGAYYRPVDRHVGEDTGGVGAAKGGRMHCLGRHAETRVPAFPTASCC